MRLREIYSTQKEQPVVSFEVFPPKNGNTEEKIQTLFKELNVLKRYNPQLISITYGAGGTTSENSFEITKKIKTELNLTPMPHFTCVLKDKEFIIQYLEMIQNFGIENILALRGDIPQNVEFTEGEFCFANELVEFIKSQSNLSIGVAGYPQGHIECENIDKDIENLKKKVDAGADVIYTQLFFENGAFFEYVDKVRNRGINIPIIPGILPVSSYTQTEKMIKMCNTRIPNELHKKLEKYKNSPEDIKKVGIEFAITQCEELMDSGVVGLHFYCLNKSQPVATILDNILK